MIVEPNKDGPGAFVKDVNVAKIIREGRAAEIKKALWQYGVVAMRNQKLTVEEFERLAAEFGKAEVPSSHRYTVPGHLTVLRISNVMDDEGQPIGLIDAGQIWHTDSIFEQKPTLYSMLYAIEIPHDDDGEPLGPTMFMSSADAYDTLDAETKNRIQGVKTANTLAQYRKTMEKLGQGEKRAPLSEERKKVKAVHPLVRTHPETGRKTLYFSDGHTAGIEGIDEEEGRALIDRLQAHSLAQDRIYKHRWAVGDVVIWDNCLMQHQAVGDYPPSKRRMLLRISTQGLTPQ